MGLGNIFVLTCIELYQNLSYVMPSILSDLLLYKDSERMLLS